MEHKLQEQQQKQTDVERILNGIIADVKGTQQPQQGVQTGRLVNVKAYLEAILSHRGLLAQIKKDTFNTFSFMSAEELIARFHQRQLNMKRS